MVAKVILFSNTDGEIDNFLNKFYNSNITSTNSMSWKKDFPNPIEISEIAAAFSDNDSLFNLNMWISLDEDVFIKVSSSNVNTIIKYIFERYPC